MHPVVSITSEKERKVEEGESVKFICSATGVGADNFIYQWFLNNLPVPGQDMPILVINAVSQDDAGDYRCFVRNQYKGTGQSEAVKLILSMYIDIHFF